MRNIVAYLCACYGCLMDKPKDKRPRIERWGTVGHHAAVMHETRFDLGKPGHNAASTGRRLTGEELAKAKRALMQRYSGKDS